MESLREEIQIILIRLTKLESKVEQLRITFQESINDIASEIFDLKGPEG